MEYKVADNCDTGRSNRVRDPGSLCLVSPDQAGCLARPTPVQHKGVADVRLWLTFPTHAVLWTPRSGVVAVAGCKGASGTAVRRPE